MREWVRLMLYDVIEVLVERRETHPNGVVIPCLHTDKAALTDDEIVELNDMGYSYKYQYSPGAVFGQHKINFKDNTKI